MTFDPTKPVRTRDGRPARIICVDRQNKYPIVALVTEAGQELVCLFTRAGKNYAIGPESDEDLVNIPQRHERWIVVGHGGDSVVLHRSEADARSSAYMREGKPKCQVLRIEWEDEA